MNVIGTKWIFKNKTNENGTYDKITRDESINGIDQTLYRSKIRSLLYLIASHLDLCYSVGLCARYQASPKDIYLLYVKKIIKYV